jgi:hypothetical protein
MWTVTSTGIAENHGVALLGCLHSFRPIAIRRYDPGAHAIELAAQRGITGCGEFLREGP